MKSLTLRCFLTFTIASALGGNTHSKTGFVRLLFRNKRQVPGLFQNNNNGDSLENQWNSVSNPLNVKRRQGEDWYVFDETRHKNIDQETTTVRIPGSATKPSLCEVLCRTTLQYNPVCGTNNITYTNEARLKCAQNCGKQIQILHPGACTMPTQKPPNRRN